jgi:hypothetical protein
VTGAVLHWRSEQARSGAMENSLTTFIASGEFQAWRMRCPADAANLGQARMPGQGHDEPPVALFAYDGEFRPANPAAPVFSSGLADQMRGKLAATSTFATPDGNGVEVGMATPWRNGPCALLLAQLPPVPGVVGREEMMSAGIAAVIAIVVGIVVWSRSSSALPNGRIATPPRP